MYRPLPLDSNEPKSRIGSWGRKFSGSWMQCSVGNNSLISMSSKVTVTSTGLEDKFP